MAYLFDTDAISEVLRPRPLARYLEWLAAVPREDQFTSAIVIGELYRGAHRSEHRDRHLSNIDSRVLSAVTVLSYDVPVARIYGQICASLEAAGSMVADADLQIAATAIHHGLELITGNLRHFERIPGLKLNRILASVRQVR